MKKKVLIGAIVGLLLATGILSILPTQTNAATETNLSVVDITCTSDPVQYDTDETFKARVTNNGLATATDVKVAFYLDGTYRNTSNPFDIPAESGKWSPEVTIHWPSDYLTHTITAKLDAPYSGEYSEWFRATLAA